MAEQRIVMALEADTTKNDKKLRELERKRKDLAKQREKDRKDALKRRNERAGHLARGRYGALARSYGRGLQSRVPKGLMRAAGGAMAIVQMRNEIRNVMIPVLEQLLPKVLSDKIKKAFTSLNAKITEIEAAQQAAKDLFEKAKDAAQAGKLNEFGAIAPELAGGFAMVAALDLHAKETSSNKRNADVTRQLIKNGQATFARSLGVRP